VEEGGCLSDELEEGGGGFRAARFGRLGHGEGEEGVLRKGDA
jgi:hypothetical protein